MKAALIALGLTAVAGAAWVRLAPVDAARWHVDPMTATPPGRNGWLVAPGADAEPPLIEAPAHEVLERLHAVATAQPRTRVVAGSVAEGRITYETRSAVWGFPDYTTVTAVGEGGAARPALLARARFGRSDFGVNRARVERWLSALN